MPYGPHGVAGAFLRPFYALSRVLHYQSATSPSPIDSAMWGVAKRADGRQTRPHAANAYEPVVRSEPAAPANGITRNATSALISPWLRGPAGKVGLMTDGDRTGALIEGCSDIHPPGPMSEPHHDPKRLIEQAFEMGAEFPGPAEDLLLSWILSLPADADAPVIAALLADRHRHQVADLADKHPARRLLTLLEQTAAAGAARASGRRGGRRGKS